MEPTGARRYLKTHEWVRLLPDGTAEVGLSAHALRMLGPLEQVSLPNRGLPVLAGESCCELESRKCVTALYAPITGVVTEVNGALEDDPTLLNREKGNGWLFRCGCVSEEGALLSAEDYLARIGERDEQEEGK